MFCFSGEEKFCLTLSSNMLTAGLYTGMMSHSTDQGDHRMTSHDRFLPCVCYWLSRVRLFAIPWTVVHLAPLSMEFSRQEYWSGLPHPSPGYLPNPGIKPGSSALHEDSLPSEPPGMPLNKF